MADRHVTGYHELKGPHSRRHRERPLAMKSKLRYLLFLLMLALLARQTLAQARPTTEDEHFGPVVTAYLGYLRNEQEVVDDRVSRREISRVYYRRNSNRIRALREVAIRIARDSGNDYLPELEAVTGDELRTLFEHPPNITSLPIGRVVNNTFRFLGPVRSAEVFYVFARLDPYEQSELKRLGSTDSEGGAGHVNAKPAQTATRPRKVGNPWR
ncbi:MAG: hypothetical protein JWM21_1149 [Acidobacteria bacterium]|nr:hypothetical protein [Acidobacteriota bacterium]